MNLKLFAHFGNVITTQADAADAGQSPCHGSGHADQEEAAEMNGQQAGGASADDLHDRGG